MIQLALLDTPEMAKPKFPTGIIVRDALIEDGCRFWLKRAWGPGPCIAWVGLNPSLADGEREDPTMLREIGFSFRWGFGSLIKLNMFPFITSSPAEMRKRLAAARSKENNSVYPCSDCLAMIENDELCAEYLYAADARMAAWGNGASVDEVNLWLDILGIDLGSLSGRGDEFIACINDWKCLGTNADGSPRHTLARGKNRVPDDFQPVPWQPPKGLTDVSGSP